MIGVVTAGSRSVTEFQTHHWSVSTVVYFCVLVLCTVGLVMSVRSGRAKDAQRMQEQDKYQIALHSILQVVVLQLHFQFARGPETTATVCSIDEPPEGAPPATKVPIPEDLVRGTVYFRQDDKMVQEIPYVGGAGGPPGRTVSIHAGIIGSAVTQGVPRFMEVKPDCTNKEQFVRHMVEQFHFEDQQAREMRDDRKAWAAVPIKDNKGRVVVVVFFDSSDVELLTKNADMVIQACKAVSEALSSKASGGSR